MPVLIALVLLVPGLLVIVEGIFKMLVHLEMPFESIELGGHGNNLLVVWGFGTPLSLLPEPIILVHGGGHQLMSEIDELAIKVVIVVAPDAHLEVVSGDNMIGIKEEPNRIVDIGTRGKQLHVILVKLAIDLVNITADRGCKHS